VKTVEEWYERIANRPFLRQQNRVEAVISAAQREAAEEMREECASHLDHEDAERIRALPLPGDET